MHTIEIPSHIIDAATRRRGRKHVFECVDPRRVALIVIDMQNAWVEPGLSALEIPETRSVVDNINWLATATRDAGGIVAWTQSTFPPDWTHRVYKHYGSAQWRNQIIDETAPDSFGHAISDRMAVAPEDLKVVKTRPSALVQGSSNLESMLRERDRDTLIITGTLTNACCESTARDSMALGFNNIFVADGTATRSDEEHNAALINLYQLVADVRMTDEVIGLLKAPSGTLKSG